jgi:hypothetical protein
MRKDEAAWDESMSDTVALSTVVTDCYKREALFTRAPLPARVGTA